MTKQYQKGQTVLIKSNESVDNYLFMEVGLPRGPDDELIRAKVKKRILDVDENPVGIAYSNPLLDTR